MEENNQKYEEEEEITLKDLIVKLQEYCKELIKNWKIILFAIFFFSVFMFYKALKAPKIYNATLTFMLNEENNGGMGGLGGLAASFGLGGSKGEFNLEKMLALSKSMNIVQQVLFDKVTLNGNEDYYANYILEEYGLIEKWKESELLKDFKSFTHDSLSLYTRAENKALKNLFSKVIGTKNQIGLLKSSLDEDTGILSFKISSTSEDLSILLVKCFYKKLSDFYIKKTIEQQTQTYQFAKTKADSLQLALNTVQYQLLKFKDTNRSLSLRQFEAKEFQLERDAQLLAMAYGEAIKNKEIADFSLRSKTPFIQVIDIPFAPIKIQKESLAKAIILGILLGIVLTFIFLILRKIIRDAMI